MTIGQMNAHDRRIVHLFLKSNTAIRTQSLGEGLYRKLMIFPRKKGNERKSVSESK
jgi:spoIIIJ-associated protein